MDFPETFNAPKLSTNTRQLGSSLIKVCARENPDLLRTKKMVLVEFSCSLISEKLSLDLKKKIKGNTRDNANTRNTVINEAARA
ncbi:hypothetical protein GCM10009113_07870 [Marinobacter szutsaonensis]